MPMRYGGRAVLLCSCDETVAPPIEALAALGAEGDAAPATQLCRKQLSQFEAALDGGEPLLVACGQEAPLFAEIAAERRGEDADIRFVDIRDGAGWSAEADKAGPKMAALAAAAAVDVKPAKTVSLKSDGVCLIYGVDESAIEAATRLAGRLDVTVLLRNPQDVIPPRQSDIPVYRGRIAGLRGHLGAFELVVDDYAASVPSARGAMAFEAPRDGASSRCDIVLDLTGGTPLVTAHDKRDGYFRPDPKDPAQVARALFDAAELIGEFEKPRYVDYDEAICAHGASKQTGCSKCLDVCPAGAIEPAGDKVAFDPYICGGCGGCASVCPTGAASYALAGGDGVNQRLRAMLAAYADAGGVATAGPPTLLIHDAAWGADQIALMARFGDGLPANVLPIAVNEVTQTSFDLLFATFAYGAAAVRLMIPPSRRAEASGLAAQIGLTESALSGLGFGEGRVGVIDVDDPDAIAEALAAIPAADAPEAGRFLPMGGKRSVAWLALRHLHDVAPTKPDEIALAPGAPFGAVEVDASACTLCLSCVSACPAGALLDDPDRPRLSFQEEACVQCGLCKAICPEDAISLAPRLNFTESARQAVEKKTEEPFGCIRCGKPFGARGSVATIAEKLAGKHSMFQSGDAADRILMCEDCRVVVQFETPNNPMAGGERPRTRTTDDDLREREEQRARSLADSN